MDKLEQFCAIWQRETTFIDGNLSSKSWIFSKFVATIKKKNVRGSKFFPLTLVLLNPERPAFANSVDPDQLASEEANWSRFALFAIQYTNLCQ